jgi:hypothetical protein
MSLAEALGCLASGLVLLTFGVRTMLPMRVAAIGSNLAFIAYGLALDLSPIWVLHGILLPLNTYRLLELLRRARRPKGRGRRRMVTRVAPAGRGRAAFRPRVDPLPPVHALSARGHQP